MTRPMMFYSATIFALMLSAFALILFSDSVLIFLLVASVMSIMVVIQMLGYFRRPLEINIYDFFSTFIAIAYGLSSLLVQINLYRQRSELLPHYFGIHQSSLSAALAGVALTCASLIFAGKHFGGKLQFPRLDEKQFRRAALIVLVVTVSAVYALSTGQLRFQGEVLLGENSKLISPFASLVSFSIPCAGVLALCLASTDEIGNKFVKWLLFLMSVFLLGAMITQGRRLIMFLALLYAIFYRMSAVSQAKKSKRMAMVILCALAAYVGYVLFFAIRIASWETNGFTDLGSLLSLSLDVVRNPSNHDLFFLLEENSLERPFVIRYLAEIIDKSYSHDWLSGEALISTLLMNVPSLVLGAKTFAVDEELIHPRFGMPVVDQANSALTTGVADFGWIGLIGYPLLSVLCIQLTLFVVRRFGSSWSIYFFQFGALFLLMSVENSMTAYWGFLRNGLLIIGVLVALGALLNLKIARRRARY